MRDLLIWDGSKSLRDIPSADVTVFDLVHLAVVFLLLLLLPLLLLLVLVVFVVLLVLVLVVVLLLAAPTSPGRVVSVYQLSMQRCCV